MENNLYNLWDDVFKGKRDFLGSKGFSDPKPKEKVYFLIDGKTKDIIAKGDNRIKLSRKCDRLDDEHGSYRYKVILSQNYNRI